MISLDSNSTSQAAELSSERVRRIVRMGLDEDWGGRDLSASLFPADATAQGVVLVKQDGILAGLPVAEVVFRERGSHGTPFVPWDFGPQIPRNIPTA